MEGRFYIIGNHKVAGLDVIETVRGNNLPRLKAYSILIFYC